MASNGCVGVYDWAGGCIMRGGCMLGRLFAWVRFIDGGCTGIMLKLLVLLLFMTGCCMLGGMYG